MNVTAVKTFLVDPGQGKNLLFVKVETDQGIHGWGECYTQSDRDQAIALHVDNMARYLCGRSAFAIKHFTYVMYQDYAGKRGAMEFYSALSGLEIALWDVVGKRLGVPVYNLLGGPCRDKIRVYANGWYSGAKTPDEFARRASEVVAQGFTAIKFDPFPNPWRAYIGRDEEQAAVACVREVREAVGPNVDILVEMHRRLAPMHAVRVARQMEEVQPFWCEEPVSSRNLSALAEARREIRVPVVAGEELYTKMEFRDLLDLRAADIINPDVCTVGGILELKEIAAMAEPHYVAVSPHNYNSTTIGLGATLQAAATIPNFLVAEYFVNLEAFGREIAVKPFTIENSHISLPTQPGLGIELDESALTRRPYRQFPVRPIRQYADER